MTNQNSSGTDTKLASDAESESIQVQDSNNENEQFSIDDIRLWDEEVEEFHVDVIPENVRVRRPGQREVYRIREGAACEMHALVIVDRVKVNNRYTDSFYFIPRLLIEKSGRVLGDNVKRKVKKVSLYLAMNNTGEYFVFPTILPDKWYNQSPLDKKAVESVSIARNKAISLLYRGDRKYEIVPSDKWPDNLEWPSFYCGEIFEYVIRKALIDSPDHEVLKKIRGDRS